MTSGIVATVALLGLTACGKGSRARDDAAPVPKDARDAAAECAQLFDRFHASVVAQLGQMGVTETAQAARDRDKAGLAACVALSTEKRTCVAGATAAATVWSTCQVAPPFTLFDATEAHVGLLGREVKPDESATRASSFAGKWQLPARGLDPAITWTIDKTGALTIERTLKNDKGKPVTEKDPPKQLTFVRERLAAIKTANSTQFAPLVRDGDRFYLSWTSGAIAIPVADENKLVLDLASEGRWAIWNGKDCTLVDPKRGLAPIACAWEAEKDSRAFAVELDGLTQRWALRQGLLFHPAMEVFSKR